MSYAKKIGVASLIQGTSFTISLGRDDKAIWGVTETGIFIVTDSLNEIVLSKNMVKSGDGLTLTWEIAQTDCTSWEGNYRITAYQIDSGNPNIKVPIGDYEVEYETTKARG